MKIVQTLGRALAWFNLIYWGLSVVTSLLQGLAAGNMAIIVASVFLAAVPLNSYASLQLHRSIRNPAVKLNHQTPVGIRFVGSFVVLIGAFLAGVGLLVVVGAKQIFPMIKENAVDMPQPFTIKSSGELVEMGAILLFFGSLMLIGAVLNMRLLRWYYLVKRSDVS
ncbi:MAG TPA: hypothetical protein VGS79_06330 [Puia sp.]|nr:hypothetical protein [Puia sp.]